MRRVAITALLLLAGCQALLLAGCRAPREEGPKVASLRSAVAGPSPTAARPLIALDASDDERARMWLPWEKCVQEKTGYENPKEAFQKNDAQAREARAACLTVEPETYEQRQQRLDISAFRDNQREWYKCAKEAGYQLTAPDENGEFGLTAIGPEGDFASPKIEACRKEAFRQ
jgi:hypothetical protein